MTRAVFRLSSESFEQIANRQHFQIGAFVVLTAFYLATQPTVRFESGDGYFYALIAERCSLLAHCKISNGLDTRSLLFHAINRVLYVLAHSVGANVSSYSIIVFLSSACGALTWLLTSRLLQRGAGLSATASWLGAACLGLTYGFWRYAGEAEVYVPSICMTVAVLSLLVDANARPASGWVGIVPAAVIAGLSVLFYRENAAPLFLAIPALLYSRRRVGRMVIYGAVGTGVFLVGIAGAYLISQSGDAPRISMFEFVFRRSSEFTGPAPLLNNPIVPLLRIGQNIGATLWVFSTEFVRHGVQSVLPNWDFSDEAYAAAQYRPYAYLPFLFFPVLVIAFLATVHSALRAPSTKLPTRLVVYLALSLAVQTIIVIGLAPLDREPWIPVMLPLIALCTVFVFRPAIAFGRLKAPILFVLALMLFNYFGGIGALSDKRGDLQLAQSAWLIENATSRDMVLMPEASWEFLSFLRYVVGAKVIVLASDGAAPKASAEIQGRESLEKEIQKVFGQGGRIFVFGEFSDAAHKRTGMQGVMASLNRGIAGRYMDRAKLVHRDSLGTIYEIPRVGP